MASRNRPRDKIFNVENLSNRDPRLHCDYFGYQNSSFHSAPPLGIGTQINHQLPRNSGSVCPNIHRKIEEMVKTYQDGIPLTHFCTIFRKHYSFTLDPQKSGFSNIHDMLASLTDAIVLKRLSPGEIWVMSSALSQATKGCLRNFHDAPDLVINTPTREKLQTGKSESRPTTTPQKGYGKPPDAAVTEKQSSPKPSTLFDIACKVGLILQDHIKNLMAKHRNGLQASRLPFEYKKRYNKDLPIKTNGYNSVIEFVADLPHIVHIERPDQHGDWLLYPVGVEVSTDTSAPKKENNMDHSCTETVIQVDDGTKEAVVQVLSVSNDTIPLSSFESVYKELTGENLEFNKFGAVSIKQFLLSLPEIVSITRDAADKPIVCLKPSNKSRRFHRLKDHYQPTISSPAQDIEPVLCLANDTVGPGCFYRKQELPEFGDELKYIELFVSNIVSPGLFWFQIRGLLTTVALEDLMDNMEAIYNSRHDKQIYHVTPSLARKGLMCAAIFPEDGFWYRALITDFRNDLFEVFYVDYGNTCYVSITQIRLLKTKFVRLPAQALQARLSNIKPAHGVWRVNSKERFLSMTRERPIVGLVTAVKDRIVSLCLTDTSQPEDVYINDTLVNEGYAFFEPDSTSQEIVIHSQAPGMDFLYGENSSQTCQDGSSVTDHVTTTRHYVRKVQMSEITSMCIINLDGQLYVTSAEISHLLFDEDILSAQLSKDKVEFPKTVVTRKDHPELFKELMTHDSRGVSDVTNMLSLFQLSIVPFVIEMYRQDENLADMSKMVAKVIHSFDKKDSYWKEKEDISTSGSSTDLDVHGSDSSDVPHLDQMKRILSSLESQREIILNEIRGGKRLTPQSEELKNLKTLDVHIKTVSAAIDDLENCQTQLAEPNLTETSDGSYLNQLAIQRAHQSALTSPEPKVASLQPEVVSPQPKVATSPKPTTKMSQILQVSPTKRVQLPKPTEGPSQAASRIENFQPTEEPSQASSTMGDFQPTEEPSQAAPRVDDFQQPTEGPSQAAARMNDLLREQFAINRILMSHLGLSQQNLAQQLQQQQSMINSKQQQQILQQTAIVNNQQHLSLLPQLWPQQQLLNRNPVSNMMHSLLPFNAYTSNNQLTNQWLLPESQLLQLSNQQQLNQLQQLTQLQQFQQTSDINSRLALLSLGQPSATNLPITQNLASRILNPSSANPSEQQTTKQL